MEKIRIDKWLWAIRLYKSRTMATEACDAGKVKIDGASVKPSKLLTVGETVHVRHNQSNKIFKVIKLIEKRVSATLAIECYEDLSPKEDADSMLKSAFYASQAKRDKGTGRPTKKDRREIDNFSDDDLSDFFN